jgi:hypothetical protein
VAYAGAALVALLVAAGCGGKERQDAHEPRGTFKVEVIDTSFPAQQKLAKRSKLRLELRNADTRKIPNIAVTLNGLDIRKNDPDLADPRRPQFVINGRGFSPGGIRDAGEAGPKSGETAYTNTWALGPLNPGESKTFTWDVTAVLAGPYRLHYLVAAGLNGKARAIDPSGHVPSGYFRGEVSNRPPQASIAEDGETVINY